MCWKYCLETATLTSWVGGICGRRRGRLFRLSSLQVDRRHGERDQIGKAFQFLGGQTSLERDGLGLGKKSPVLHPAEQHTVLLEGT